MTSLPLLTWDEFTDQVPYPHDRWATSPRGWCHDEGNPAGWQGNEQTCVGNYLQYSGDHGPNGETVHACAYRFTWNGLSSTIGTLGNASAWFHTIPEAKAWIEAKALEYEYHCNESETSADARLWHRTHQRVTVLRQLMPTESAFEMYDVRFPDQTTGHVFADELMTTRRHFCRPDYRARLDGQE